MKLANLFPGRIQLFPNFLSKKDKAFFLLMQLFDNLESLLYDW